ncbi:hypothetical protein [Roseovarius sp. D22-M7]
MTFSASDIHGERTLQKHLINRMVTGHGYLRRDAKSDYDRALATRRRGIS